MIYSRILRGGDLFPCCVDIHGIVSTHVETVVLLTREKVDNYLNIDLDIEKLEGKSGTAMYEEIKSIF